jgi:hypothetical protein
MISKRDTGRVLAAAAADASAKVSAAVPAYAGLENYAFGGGLIIKHGIGTFAAGLATIAFGTPFPTGFDLAFAVAKHTANEAVCIGTVYNPSVSGFSVCANVNTNREFYWLAIGH